MKRDDVKFRRAMIKFYGIPLEITESIYLSDLFGIIQSVHHRSIPKKSVNNSCLCKHADQLEQNGDGLLERSNKRLK